MFYHGHLGSLIFHLFSSQELDEKINKLKLRLKEWGSLNHHPNCWSTMAAASQKRRQKGTGKASIW